ncbi:MAG: divalent-cation tolerance protein CutA [Verrucomicrobiota bacterium]
MKAKKQVAIVLVTAPDLKVARLLAKKVLESRLAACANLVPAVESHYWWKGKLESNAEVLLILKTTGARLAKLKKCIEENHPYDTPEFIVLRINSGGKRYLDWIAESVK